ncbi:MAG: hypothetical protein WCJ33_04140 [Pseudomonadota bacterium]
MNTEKNGDELEQSKYLYILSRITPFLCVIVALIKAIDISEHYSDYTQYKIIDLFLVFARVTYAIPRFTIIFKTNNIEGIEKLKYEYKSCIMLSNVTVVIFFLAIFFIITDAIANLDIKKTGLIMAFIWLNLLVNNYRGKELKNMIDKQTK